MELVLYTSDKVGEDKNVRYPYRTVVKNADEMKAAIRHDHVCAKYKNNYRGKDRFISSTVIVMDCDNDHSEEPKDWITPEAMRDEFSDVPFALTFSRHHMKQKDNKSPRPRFHIYFQIPEIRDHEKYKALKERIHAEYPFFDKGALDAGRFIYGSKSDEVIWNEGKVTVDSFISHIEIRRTIKEGTRNSTLSRFAGRVLIRYGDTDKALELFREQADRCEPPLEEEELKTIWKSAVRFAAKISKKEGYVPPDQYKDPESLKPEDYSDVGQAKMLAKQYGDELIYTSATDFLRFDGRVWQEDKQLAVGATVEFTDLQLRDALDQVQKAMKDLNASGANEELIRQGGRSAMKAVAGNENQMKLLAAYQSAVSYYAFVMKRRDMKYITSALSVAKALLNRSVNDMDKDPNLLNTPDGTIDLAKGADGMREHKAEDLITKMTEASPGDMGRDIWNDTLQLFFQNNDELIEYVQLVVGMAAVGKVYQEHLIIAYGDGANGKSTFWNTIARVLGTYSGKISAEVLTVGNKRNAKPEMAELKGKRLIIASETEEGMRLNTSIVKQLCSVDPIQAEKKYEKPFDFIPTHTLVLYTNHLPRVGANDDGIWRRLIVIPFNAKIQGRKDIKNYSDYLYEHAAPAIMNWIVEGSRKAIERQFRWPLPKVVQDAIEDYRQQNDWLGQFLADCCEVDPSKEEKSGKLYNAYRNYCLQTNEYTRSTSDFYDALKNAGFIRQRRRSGTIVRGLSVKPEEFLND